MTIDDPQPTDCRYCGQSLLPDPQRHSCDIHHLWLMVEDLKKQIEERRRVILELQNVAALAERNGKSADQWRDTAAAIVSLMHRSHDGHAKGVPWTSCRHAECVEARGLLAVAYEAVRS